ncbi:DUF1697 domain-containing protein [Rathayibacter soli]|uniref:DUF1697 domain-containing protein n=1 Tax=Rathayibacter soli TaxID=3144168 RepID=UPI0027E46C0D|nr:DUF1697 domain-containing protein [Glaciibacter superstes]
MVKYVALLRGINVGGKSLISMRALANCFREAGYEGVRTHIQSGNVLFASVSPGGADLEAALERMLRQRFDTPIPTIVRSRDELAATIAAAPANHGSTELRSEVFFLKRQLTAAAVIAQLPELREGVDSISSGPGALDVPLVGGARSDERSQICPGKNAEFPLAGRPS